MTRNPADYPNRACRDADTELFFPTPGKQTKARAVIRDYCDQCPIRAECLEWALSLEGSVPRGARSGIYGGTFPDERASMAERGPRPITHGTEGGHRTHRRRGEEPCRSCADAAAAAKRARRARRAKRAKAAS